jgi:WD40 repeat protein
VRLWDLDSWTERTVLAGPPKPPRTLAFSPDDETLTAFDLVGGRSTWNVATGRLLTSDVPPTPEGWVHVAASGDGSRLAIGKNPANGMEVHNASRRESVARIDRLDPGSLHSLALSRGGQLLAACEGLRETTGRALTRVFDVGTGKEFARRQSGRDEWETVRLAFSPRGNRLVGRCYGDWLWAWNLETGESSRIPFKGGRSAGLAFSPDGGLLATGGPERTITLLDPATLQTRARLVNHTGAVHGLDFAPDGRTLASAAADRTVRLWNVATGQELLKLDGHTGPVYCVQFSHDGRTLASAAETPAGATEVILWHTDVPPRESDTNPRMASTSASE